MREIAEATKGHAVSHQCRFHGSIFVIAPARSGSTARSYDPRLRPDISGYSDTHIRFDARVAGSGTAFGAISCRQGFDLAFEKRFVGGAASREQGTGNSKARGRIPRVEPRPAGRHNEHIEVPDVSPGLRRAAEAACARHLDLFAARALHA